MRRHTGRRDRPAEDPSHPGRKVSSADRERPASRRRVRSRPAIRARERRTAPTSTAPRDRHGPAGRSRAGDAASPLLLGAEDRAISVITVSELLHGVHRAQGAVRARLRAFVEHLLAGLEAIPITEPVARVHAYIWADLAGRGQQIGARDLWISATALAGPGIASRVSAGTSERDPRSRATSNLAGSLGILRTLGWGDDGRRRRGDLLHPLRPSRHALPSAACVRFKGLSVMTFLLRTFPALWVRVRTETAQSG